jgi:uncharacterized membrane protein
LTRLWTRWFDIRNSLWFLPAVLTIAIGLLAFGTIWVDSALLLERRSDIVWFFGGGAEGARGVLSAIAGTMITVTALVFSITVVALQLAASQLSPRVLRSFMGDRPNQVVLGFFIATFTYALLVLRAVRSPLEGEGGFVPALSVTVAIVLALASVGLLIFFVHHAADSMRTSVVINRAAKTALDLVDHLFPEDVGQPRQPAPPAWLETEPAGVVPAERGGYLRAVNGDALFALAEKRSLTVRPTPGIGDFVLPGATLAEVWPAAALDEKVTDAVRAALELGSERSPQQDLAFAIQMLVDIAVRALSPGVNDPTTATISLDRLSEVMTLLGNRDWPDPVRSGEQEKIRLVLRGPAYETLVDLAFAAIRWYGAGDPVVAAHLIASLGQVAALAPADRRECLIIQAQNCFLAARAKVNLPSDQARLLAAAAWLPAGPDQSWSGSISG